MVLPNAYCPLFTAYYLLPTALCPLPTASGHHVHYFAIIRAGSDATTNSNLQRLEDVHVPGHPQETA